MAGNCSASQTDADRGPVEERSKTAAGAAEMGAPEQPPMARGGAPRRATRRPEVSGGGGAGVVGPALRCALNAPPFGLRRATRRAGPTTKKRTKAKKQKGDTSNEVTKGTFLKSFDIASCCWVTSPSPGCMLFILNLIGPQDAERQPCAPTRLKRSEVLSDEHAAAQNQLTSYKTRLRLLIGEMF